MKQRFRNKSVAKRSVVRGESAVHSPEGDRQSMTDELLPPLVSASDGSQQSTVASDRVCRQYHRRRVVDSDAGEDGGSISRLGIASNLL